MKEEIKEIKKIIVPIDKKFQEKLKYKLKYNKSVIMQENEIDFFIQP